MFNYLAIFEILLAAYLIFAAITGKSKVFATPYIKEGMQEKYKKTGRIGFFVIGGLVLILGILNAYASAAYMGGRIDETALSALGTVSTIMTALVLTALLALYFIFNSMTDKSKKARPPRSQAPRAAFFFDEDEEEKAPAKQKNQKRK